MEDYRRRWRDLDLMTASIIQRSYGEGGNIPRVYHEDACARVTAAEVKENADNASVIDVEGVNHLVITVYSDHWHIESVSGYTPEKGTFTIPCEAAA